MNLEFKRQNYENLVGFQFSNDFSAVFGDIPFSIQPNDQLIYLISTNETLIYHFTIDNNEKLILSIDRERTLKKNSKHER